MTPDKRGHDSLHNDPRTAGVSQNRRRRLLRNGLAAGLMIGACGCTQMPSVPMHKLDLMSPSSSILFPGQRKKDSPYEMPDGSPTSMIAADGSMTMESYRKIKEAKAKNAVVLQVAGDDTPVRVLPLPPEQKSVFVSELLTQTGVLNKFGRIHATVFRPSPDSIEGVRMDVKFAKDGTIDPVTDYGLRAGDRISVRQVRTTGMKALVDTVLRR